MTTYKLSFLIKGLELEFNAIGARLSIVPSQIVHKGDKVSKIIDPATTDMWAYEVKCQGEEELYDEIRKLYKCLLTEATYLESLIGNYNVSIKIFINSEFAQMHLSLPHDIVLLLSQISIEFNISIFSWGKVLDK